MSVEFPPARVGPRRRRIDPVVPAIAVIVAMIGVAVAKPWASIVPEQAMASLAPVASAAIVTPTAVPTVEQEVAGIASAIRPHDGWGIRAIVDRPEGFVETWAPAIGGTGDGTFASALRPDATVVAIGVTAPSGIAVDAVRVMRASTDGIDWVATRPLVTDPSVLFVPSSQGRPDDDGWAPGPYRVDVLVGRHVRRISLAIPDGSGTVPEQARSTSVPANLVGARDTDPSSVRAGLFATVDGRAVALRSMPGERLDEAAAWSASASGEHGNAAPRVAIVTIPRATGLGVMLPERAQVRAVTLDRVAPEPLRAPIITFGGVSSVRGQVPYVALQPGDGGAIRPGVYALTVDWMDEMGDHARTWHVELRPAG